MELESLSSKSGHITNCFKFGHLTDMFAKLAKRAIKPTYQAMLICSPKSHYAVSQDIGIYVFRCKNGKG